jgi:hypothetical protein
MDDRSMFGGYAKLCIDHRGKAFAKKKWAIHR